MPQPVVYLAFANDPSAPLPMLTEEALIHSQFDELHRLAECRNETHFRNR